MFLDELRDKALNNDKLAEINKEIDQLESDLQKRKEQAYDDFAKAMLLNIKAQIKKEVENGKFKTTNEGRTINSKIEFENSVENGIHIGEENYRRIKDANRQIESKKLPRKKIYIENYGASELSGYRYGDRSFLKFGLRDDDPAIYNNVAMEFRLINHGFEKKEEIKRGLIVKKKINSCFCTFVNEELLKKAILKTIELASHEKIIINKYYFDVKYSNGHYDSCDIWVENKYNKIINFENTFITENDRMSFDSAKLVFEYSVTF